MNTLIVGWALAHLVAAFPSTDLERVRWLSGCWQTRDGGVTEVWSPPVGGVMVGAGLTSRDGRAVAVEHLRIEEHADGSIMYVARPSGQTETTFRSTEVSERGFVVENPAHDFPTRLKYTALDWDRVAAEVTGPGEDGEIRGFQLEFRRIDCEVPR